jgi:hypothetical protein
MPRNDCNANESPNPSLSAQKRRERERSTHTGCQCVTGSVHLFWAVSERENVKREQHLCLTDPLPTSAQNTAQQVHGHASGAQLHQAREE